MPVKIKDVYEYWCLGQRRRELAKAIARSEDTHDNTEHREELAEIEMKIAKLQEQ